MDSKNYRVTSLYGYTVTTRMTLVNEEKNIWEFTAETVEDYTGYVINVRTMYNTDNIGFGEVHAMAVGVAYLFHNEE